MSYVTRAMNGEFWEPGQSDEIRRPHGCTENPVRKRVRKSVFRKSKGKCHYCGCQITLQSMTIDHRHPRSRGGENKVRNMVAACEECNKLKSDMSVTRFRRLLAQRQLDSKDNGNG